LDPPEFVRLGFPAADAARWPSDVQLASLSHLRVGFVSALLRVAFAICVIFFGERGCAIWPARVALFVGFSDVVLAAALAVALRTGFFLRGRIDWSSASIGAVGTLRAMALVVGMIGDRVE